MSNKIFPMLPGVAIGIKRTPEFSTERKTAWTGRETRIAKWAYPRWHYVLQFNVLRISENELAQIEAFFCAHMGGFESFLFLDPLYNEVTAQSFGTGDGSTTTFQLCRTINDWAEPVWAPADGFKIYKAGVEQVLNTDYTAGSTGAIQFVSAPATAAVLTWSGSYYMRVTFASDKLDFEKMLRLFWKTGQIELLSDVF